jgi:hypothetical protein
MPSPAQSRLNTASSYFLASISSAAFIRCTNDGAERPPTACQVNNRTLPQGGNLACEGLNLRLEPVTLGLDLGQFGGKLLGPWLVPPQRASVTSTITMNTLRIIAFPP